MPNDPRFNVPLQLSSFIGREAATAEVTRLLVRAPNGPRLLTLTGPGGVGKTRLALRVASGLVNAYPDGVGLVEFAPVARESLVVQTVSDLFGVREEQGRSLIATLSDYLRPRKVLLILDNCEHLVGACAALAECLLSVCPDLRILATSRELLAIPGEVAWRVPPLTLPYPEHLPDLIEVQRYESVQLFVDRARAVMPQFDLTALTARPVAEICYRLDGIPLAIELAAARVSVLGVDQISERLDHRFDLLTSGRRTAMPRQQTLRAMIAWSYELLSPTERCLFQRLGVFAGSFTLEAIEWVSRVGYSHSSKDAFGPAADTRLPTRQEVLVVLGALVDKSLVVAEQGEDGGVRYRLLETLREYARELLVTSGELDATERSHALFFQILAERAEPELNRLHQLTWFETLKRDYPNLRAALRWALKWGEVEISLRLAGALGWFWEMRGHHTEGRRWLGEALALPEAALPTRARARALGAASFLTWVQGEFALARGFAEESIVVSRHVDDRWCLAWAHMCLGCIARSEANYAAAWSSFNASLGLYREMDDPWGVPMSLFLLGTICYFRGEYPRARALFEESLALGRAIGDRWTIASSLGDLGDVAYREGKLGLARALSEESIAVARQMGMARVVAWRFFNLGRIALAQGESSEAENYLRESLTILREPGDLLRIAVVLEGLAAVAAARHQPDRAYRLVGAASAVRGAIGAPRSPGDEADLDHWLAPIRQKDGLESRTGWIAEGTLMSLDQAIEYALSDVSGAPAGSPTPSVTVLSRREREVALLVAEGCTNREIAERLVISEGTARVHVAHILDRLGLRSRAQIAVWAVETGLFSASANPGERRSR